MQSNQKQKFNKLTNIIRTPFFSYSKGGTVSEAKEILCRNFDEAVNKKDFYLTKLTNIIRTPFFGNSNGGDLFEMKVAASSDLLKSEAVCGVKKSSMLKLIIKNKEVA
jgi:hypothetical protein